MLKDRKLLDAIRKLCTHENPKLKSWYRYQRGFRPGEFVTSAQKERGGGFSFPRGIASAIVEIVPDALFEDRRVWVPAPTLEWRGPQPYDYQQRCIDAGHEALSARAWAGGIWRSPPASGKTNAALKFIAEAGQRTLVIAPTSGVYSQWIERARNLLGTEPGEIQGKKKTIGEVITVGSQKTLWRYPKEFANEFGILLIDEAQLGASRTYQKVIDASSAGFRFAVSGDERRSDGREFFIYDQFGGVSAEVEKQEVIDSGGAVEVDVVIVPTEFECDWYKHLGPSDKFDQRDTMLQQMGADPDRNALVVEVVRRCAAEGGQVIALTLRRDHAERIDAALCAYGPSVLLVGGQVERNRVEFAQGRARFAVGTYQAIGVGFESHRELGRGVFAMPVVSSSNEKGVYQLNQFLGRFARSCAGKGKAVCYYILDVRVFGKRPAALIRRWCGKDHTFVLLGDRVLPIDNWLKGKEKAHEEKDDDNGTGFFGFGY
jgi:hypothetical protein